MSKLLYKIIITETTGSPYETGPYLYRETFKTLEEAEEAIVRMGEECERKYIGSVFHQDDWSVWFGDEQLVMFQMVIGKKCTLYHSPVNPVKLCLRAKCD